MADDNGIKEETLEKLINKIDELTETIKERKIITGDIKEETNVLEKLADKIEELTETICEKKIVVEDKIKENPLAYIVGAFTGGILVGFLMSKGKEGKE